MKSKTDKKPSQQEMQDRLSEQQDRHEKRLGHIKHEILDALQWGTDRDGLDVFHALELMLCKYREMVAANSSLEQENHMLRLGLPASKEAVF